MLQTYTQVAAAKEDHEAKRNMGTGLIVYKENNKEVSFIMTMGSSSKSLWESILTPLK